MAKIKRVRNDGKYVYRRWIAQYVGERVLEINKRAKDGHAAELTDDEKALSFVNEEIGHIHKKLVALGKKKTVIVPSNDCQQVLVLYQEAKGKLDILRLALMRSGCPDVRDPVKVMEWIKQIANPVN